MATTKLTLSVERDLVEDAKRVARRGGTSLSAMVSRLLRGVVGQGGGGGRVGPITRRATGLVKLPKRKSDRDLVEEALRDRYQMKE